MLARFRNNAASSELTASPPLIDLSRSIPPLPPTFTSTLKDTLCELAANEAIAHLIRNGTAGGTEVDRAAGRQWIQSRLPQSLTCDRLFVTNGTQSALLLLLEQLIGNGGVLAAEALSYGVLSQLATSANVRIRAVQLDAEGIDPQSFELICKTDAPRALYCNPTVHNPTAAMMSTSRRVAIAEIARRYSVAILEDEPLGCLHLEAPPPIATIAPDITWYIAGLTKGLAHGLRVAYVVCPTEADAHAIIAGSNRLSHWFPSPIATAIVNNLIVSGRAEQIRKSIANEAANRQRAAQAILANRGVIIQPGGLHAWLPLPPDRDRHQLVRTLATDGVLVRPSDVFAVEPEKNHVNAIRISLSSPLHSVDVERGVLIIDRTLELWQ